MERNTFPKTIPTIPMPSTILVPGVNGVISQANLMVGNDSTWIDNGLIANKQISLRDTVQMKMEVATSGIISRI